MSIKFTEIDGCAVPSKLAPEIRELKRRTGATLVSCDRSPEAGPILRRNGKQTQKQLYDGYVAGKPGYNPANPPGRSTHERRSDGVAYRGPVGRRLRYWQVGMDWSNAGAIVREAREVGFTATITYPRNPREGHHVNFRKEPVLPIPFRVLKRGSKGLKVRILTRRLVLLDYLDGPSNTYTERIEKAVKKFQKDHEQKADGIYGRQTHRQIQASVRYRKRNPR